MTPLVGVHQSTGPASTVAQYPLTKIVREFKGGVIKPQNLVTIVNNACKAAWAQGLVVAWSVKLDVASVMSGAWQPYLEQLA